MRFLTAGESHGPALVGIIEGLPAGLKIDIDKINNELIRRQAGYGRGPRARKIEKDRVEILSGLWKDKTLGSPLALMITNLDYAKRGGKLHPDWPAPRPGHADLPGKIRYDYDGYAQVAERASARSTAMTVAIGAIAKQLLKQFKVEVLSHTVSVGMITADAEATLTKLRRAASNLRCLDKNAEKLMCNEIDIAEKAGATLGGAFEVIAFGMPAGVGTYVHPDRKLDAKIASAVMSVPSVKAVEFGSAIAASICNGQIAHDELFPDGNGSYIRESNIAGGLEGGITNGENICITGFVKPISTQKAGLHS
ncbi:chorismate synthase, partial [bacterium]|nr:chorismate synthase [bacterium]